MRTGGGLFFTASLLFLLRTCSGIELEIFFFFFDIEVIACSGLGREGCRVIFC